MYLSELIGEDFKNWTACDEIFIQTPTGSGKTTFIVETLAPYAEKKGEKCYFWLIERYFAAKLNRDWQKVTASKV